MKSQPPGNMRTPCMQSTWWPLVGWMGGFCLQSPLGATRFLLREVYNLFWNLKHILRKFSNPEESCGILFYNIGSSWKDISGGKKVSFIVISKVPPPEQHKPFSLYFISGPDSGAHWGSCLYGARDELWKWTVLFQRTYDLCPSRSEEAWGLSEVASQWAARSHQTKPPAVKLDIPNAPPGTMR